MPKPDEMRAPSTGVFISMFLALLPFGVEIFDAVGRLEAIKRVRVTAQHHRGGKDVAALRGLDPSGV